MKKNPGHFPVDRLPPFPLGEIAHHVIALRAQGRDVIDLSQLNPSLPPNGGAVERLVQASLLPHNHKYSSSQGIRRLREAMSIGAQREGRQLIGHQDEQIRLSGVHCRSMRIRWFE